MGRSFDICFELFTRDFATANPYDVSCAAHGGRIRFFCSIFVTSKQNPRCLLRETPLATVCSSINIPVVSKFFLPPFAPPSDHTILPPNFLILTTVFFSPPVSLPSSPRPFFARSWWHGRRWPRWRRRGRLGRLGRGGLGGRGRKQLARGSHRQQQQRSTQRGFVCSDCPSSSGTCSRTGRRLPVARRRRDRCCCGLHDAASSAQKCARSRGHGLEPGPRHGQRWRSWRWRCDGPEEDGRWRGWGRERAGRVRRHLA